MLIYKSRPIFFNSSIPRDSFVTVNGSNDIHMNPYAGATLILVELGSYKALFETAGINKDTLDSCCDYAHKKVMNLINQKYERTN